MATCNTYHLDDPRRACILPAGHTGPHKSTNETWYDPADDMDGGVAAALIEQEAEQHDPSVDYHAMWWKAEREREKAERERDQARRERDSWRAQVPLADWEMELVRATETPRPLTPDAITDEAVRLVQERIKRRATYIPTKTIRLALEDAFAPARPEGAEEIEAYMRELVASHPEDHYGELADQLASRGVLPPLTDKTNPVRVVSEEQP